MSNTELRAENKALGWAEIPTGCPQRTLDRICEYRSRVLAGIETRATAPQAQGEAAVLRNRLNEIRF